MVLGTYHLYYFLLITKTICACQKVFFLFAQHRCSMKQVIFRCSDTQGRGQARAPLLSGVWSVTIAGAAEATSPYHSRQQHKPARANKNLPTSTISLFP